MNVIYLHQPREHRVARQRRELKSRCRASTHSSKISQHFKTVGDPHDPGCYIHTVTSGVHLRCSLQPLLSTSSLLLTGLWWSCFHSQRWPLDLTHGVLQPKSMPPVIMGNGHSTMSVTVNARQMSAAGPKRNQSVDSTCP